MRRKGKLFLKKVLKMMNKPEMRILPGQLSFFLLLSIIPLVAVIAAVAAEISLSIENLIIIINNSLPKEIADFIVSIIGGKTINMNIIIFCISGFILASNGPHSMIIGANLIYKIKDNDYLASRIKALFMTIILVTLFLFVLIVPGFGGMIVDAITSFLPSDYLGKIIHFLYNLLNYPVSLLVIYFFIKILYTMAPDTKIKSRETTKGALFTTVGWIISTEIYTFYVSYFAGYNLLYGSVANLLILFLWIYILSYIFVLGMILNATSKEEIDKNKE